MGHDRDDIECFEHCGFTIRIVRDEDAENPEENCDTPVYLGHYHRQFHNHSKELPWEDSAESCWAWLRPPEEPPRSRDWDGTVGLDDGDVENGDEHRARRREDNDADWEEYDANLADHTQRHAEYAVFLVSAYIHNNVVLALAGSAEDYTFPDRGWDVSVIGAIAIKKDGDWGERSDDAGYYYHKTTPDGHVSERAETFTSWAQVAETHLTAWNTYLSGGVCGFIVEDEDGETIESCFGFYDQDECIAEAKSQAKAERRGRDEEAADFATFCTDLDPTKVASCIRRRKAAEASLLSLCSIEDQVNYLLEGFHSREELAAAVAEED